MPIWCRTQASEIGDACREVVDQLLEVNALYQLRAAQRASRTAEEVRRHAPGSRLRQSDHGRRPVLPHHQGHPRRRRRNRPRARAQRRCRRRGLPPRPAGLFGSVAPPDTPEDTRDDQAHGEDEVAARRCGARTGCLADTADPTGCGPGDLSGQGGSSGSASAHKLSSTIHGRVLTFHERPNRPTSHARPAHHHKILLRTLSKRRSFVQFLPTFAPGLLSWGKIGKVPSGARRTLTSTSANVPVAVPAN